LLGANGFEHVYLFSSITIFISLTFFCNKRWEFVTVSVLNPIAILGAYYYRAKTIYIGHHTCCFAGCFYADSLCIVLCDGSYQAQFKKALGDVLQLNESPGS
jgi:two-component system sensor histidine kinase/response regulator